MVLKCDRKERKTCKGIILFGISVISLRLIKPNESG